MPRIMYVLGILCTLMFASCASRQVTRVESQALLPEIDLVQMKENSDEALRLAQEAKLDVEAVNSRLTSIDNRMVALNEEVALGSSAKLEELEYRIALIVEAMQDISHDMHILKSMPRSGVIVSSGKKTPGAPTSGNGFTFSPSSAASILEITPQYTAYTNALQVYNARNFKEAITLFSNAITQYPTDRYSDACNFWIGECNYQLGDFAQAIVAYQKVHTFANSQKADDAQMKIGMSHLKMGQTAAALTAYSQLIDRYPGSEYVERAKKYLTAVK